VVILSEKEALDCLSFFGGWDIPRSRFNKWREEELVLPAHQRHWLGPSMGRSGFGYSAAIVEQAAQIARMRQDNLDFDEIGWRLWLGCYKIGEKHWFNAFEWAAKQYDILVPTIRKAQETDELAEGPIEKLIEKAWRSRKSSRLFKRIKKSLGPDRFKKVMNQVLSMATGTFVQISSQYELGSNERREDLRAMDLTLGLAHARTDIVEEKRRIIGGDDDYSTTLRATFEPLGQIASLTSVLETIDREQLRTVTKSLTGLLQSIADASVELDRLLIKDAFGLSRVAEFARIDRNIHAGMALVWTLVHHSEHEEPNGLELLSKRFLAATIAARKFLERDQLDPNSKRPEFRRITIGKRPKK
jgi:hypothetical protein